jgi:hypothetical protein
LAWGYAIGGGGGEGGGENVIIIVVLDIVRTNTDIQIRGFVLDR